MDLKSVLAAYPGATQESHDLVLAATGDELRTAIRQLLEEHGRFPIPVRESGFTVTARDGRVLGEHVEPDGAIAVEDLGDTTIAARVIVECCFGHARD
jgi:hypothetical protein